MNESSVNSLLQRIKSALQITEWCPACRNKEFTLVSYRFVEGETDMLDEFQFECKSKACKNWWFVKRNIVI